MTDERHSLPRSALDALLTAVALGEGFRLAYWGALSHLRRLPLHFDSIRDFPFVSTWTKPEPFELPLYALVMTLALLVVLASARKGWSTKKWNRASRRSAAALGLLLFADLLRHLGHFPFFNVHPVDSPAIWLCSLSILATAFGGIFLLARVPIGTHRGAWADAAAAIVAFFLIFEPGLPMSVYDYGFWLGPAWEISRGKTIYTQVSSVYGFAATLATALLFKLGLPMEFTPYFIVLGYVADTFLLYLIVSRASKSRALGWAAMCAILELRFLAISGTITQTVMPNSFRFIFASLLAFCTLETGLTTTITAMAAAAAPFWVPDAGIEILGAYIGACGALALLGRLSPRRAVRLAGLILANISAWVMALQALHWALGYRLIDFKRMFWAMHMYAVGGLNMIPFPRESYFYLIVVFIALGWEVSVSALNHDRASAERDAEAETLMLLSCLAFTTCAYYIGRTSESNLFSVSALPICTVALAAIALLRRRTKSGWTRRHADMLVSSGVILIFVAVVNIQTRASAYAFLNRRVAAYRRLGAFSAVMPGPERGPTLAWSEAGAISRQIGPEAAELRSRISAEELSRPLAILSADDTYLHEALKTSSIFRNNPIHGAYDRYSVEEAADILRHNCQPHLIVDRSVLKDLEPNGTIGASGRPEEEDLLRYLLAEARKSCFYKEEYCGDSICLLAYANITKENR